jgi:hypothetical protein
VGEDVDGKEVRTGGTNGGRRGSVAGARARAREERPGVSFYSRWGRLRGCGVNHVAGAHAAWAARHGDVRRSGDPMARGGWHAGEWETATWRRPSAHKRHQQ